LEAADQLVPTIGKNEYLPSEDRQRMDQHSGIIVKKVGRHGAT